MTTRLLMIEDDEDLSRMVSEYFSQAGIEVVRAASAGAGFERLDKQRFDALILDVMLPDQDGFEVCRRVRARSDLPILMLTARGDATDRIVGLELGADDYLPKPFNPRELLARIKAILRRGGTGGAPARTLTFGHLEIDPEERSVRVNGKPRSLTAHQFDLLLVLASNAGRVMTRDALMNAVRGDSLDAFDRSIDVHISRIRAAIEANPKKPKRILTLRGAGYLFVRQQGD